MTDEDRVNKLEKTVKGFNLTVNNINVQGGFPESKPQASLSDRITQLEKLHDNFQIIGGHNVTVEGSLKTGYAICATCPQAQSGSTTPPSPPPPEQTGACCDEEGNCTITTQSACEEAGSTYIGDFTTCDPNPCECCNVSPTSVSGTVTFSYTGTNGVDGDRVISGSGAFAESLPIPFGSGVFTGTDCCDEDCLDLADGFVNLELTITCDDAGWHIHLFIGLPSWCGFETSFLKNYIYASCQDGTGSFSADLTLEGGAPFGSGSCHIDFTLS